MWWKFLNQIFGRVISDMLDRCPCFQWRVTATHIAESWRGIECRRQLEASLCRQLFLDRKCHRSLRCIEPTGMCEMGTFCAIVSSEAGKRTSISLLLRDRMKAVTKPIGQHFGASDDFICDTHVLMCNRSASSARLDPRPRFGLHDFSIDGYAPRRVAAETPLALPAVHVLKAFLV